jgi:hypothetical protein
LHAPLAYVAGDNRAAAVLGHMRLLPKFTLLRDDRAGVGLGILGELRLPTHTDQFSGGARNLAGGAKFLLDHRFGLSGLRLGLELGVLLREIGGHTDNTGPREFNMQLSRARARSVRQYLIAHGIAPQRLGAQGYGPDRPLGDNNSEAGRAQNRRVEFVTQH